MAKELIIPVKMDLAEALKQLKALEKAAGDVGDKTDKEAKKATFSFNDLGDAANMVASHFTAMALAGAGIKAVGDIVGTIASQAKEAAEYVNKQVEGFNALREAMLQIQVLKGQIPTGAGTKELIEKAEKAKILTPTEYGVGEKAFQQFGSIYVGDVAKGGRIAQETVDKILPNILATAKARGMAPDVAARALSTIIKGMPAGTKGEDYQRVFMGLMKVAETSRGTPQSTAEAFLTVASEGVGEGLPLGEGEKGLQAAMRMIGVQQESHPGEAATYATDLLRGLRMISVHGKEAELGIKEGMTPEEQLGAIYKSFQASKEKDFGKWFFPKVGGRGGDISMRAIQTGIWSGIKQGAFEKMGAAMTGATTRDMPAYLEAFKAGDIGRQMEEVTGTTRAEARIGAGPEAQFWVEEKEKARRQLTQEERFTPKGKTWGDVVRGTVGAGWVARQLGAEPGGLDEMLIRERALQNIAPTAFARGSVPMAPTEAGAQTLVHAWLKEIADNTKKDQTLAAPPPQREGQR